MPSHTQPSPDIADTSGYGVVVGPSVYTNWNILKGASGDRSFSVDFELGYDRQAGVAVGDTVHEADTLYIHQINATEGYKLGTAAVALTIAYGQGRGFEVARMGIINPRVVSIVDKLRRLDLIDECYFLPANSFEIHAEPATADFRALPGTVPAAEAVLYLEENEAKIEAIRQSGRSIEETDNIYNYVDCVAFFSSTPPAQAVHQ